MAESTQRGVRWTVFGVLLFMLVVVVSFIHRVGEPRLMSLAETRANGLFLFDTPRDPGAFSLMDHHGTAFTRDALTNRWTLIFLASPTALIFVPLRSRSWRSSKHSSLIPKPMTCKS